MRLSREIAKLAFDIVSVEFDTQEELEQYRREHDVRPETRLTVKKYDKKQVEKSALEHWKEEQAAKDNHIRGFRRNIERAVSGTERTEDKKVAKEKAKKLSNDFPKSDKVSTILTNLAIGKIDKEQAVRSIEKIVEEDFKEKKIAENREMFLKSGYSPDFLHFLPPTIKVSVGRDGHVDKVMESYNRKERTWETMTDKLSHIAKNFNAMVADIKQDMKSDDERTRILALMSAIVIDTGLRPGAEGNYAFTVNTETGEKTKIDTFGVSTLKPEHIQVIREDLARFDFIGKMGSRQVAELTDKEVISRLKELSESSNRDFLFTTKDGKKISDENLRDYMSKKWGDISPTDFRKLKASGEFYSSLKKQAEEMRDKLKEAMEKEQEGAANKIVQLIVEALKKSAEAAQKALSHDKPDVTIEHYIDPRIVMNFLHNGGVLDRIQDILGNNNGVNINFDIGRFMKNMVGRSKTAAKKKKPSPKEVMEKLNKLIKNLEKAGVK